MLFVPPSMPFMVPEAEAATTHTIEMTETGFSQTIIQIEVGDSIRFLNTHMKANGSLEPHAISDPESIAVSELSYIITDNSYPSHTFSSDKINFGNPGTEKFYDRFLDDDDGSCCPELAAQAGGSCCPVIVFILEPADHKVTISSSGFSVTSLNAEMSDRIRFVSTTDFNWIIFSEGLLGGQHVIRSEGTTWLGFGCWPSGTEPTAETTGVFTVTQHATYGDDLGLTPLTVTINCPDTTPPTIWFNNLNCEYVSAESLCLDYTTITRIALNSTGYNFYWHPLASDDVSTYTSGIDIWCTVNNVVQERGIYWGKWQHNVLFPIGTTQVTCTAADAAGNTSSESFVINVLEPLGYTCMTYHNPVPCDTTPPEYVVLEQFMDDFMTATAVNNSTSPTGRTLTVINDRISCDQFETLWDCSWSNMPSMTLNFKIKKGGTTFFDSTESYYAGNQYQSDYWSILATWNTHSWSIPIPEDWTGGTYTIIWDWTTPFYVDDIQHTVSGSHSSTFTVPAPPTGSDTTPPVVEVANFNGVTIPSEISVSATNSTGQNYRWVLSVSDATINDGIPFLIYWQIDSWQSSSVNAINDILQNISCNYDNGFLFPLGVTTVTCTVSDAAGNEGTDSFTVSVTLEGVAETTLPTVTATAYLNATSPTGRTLKLTANDWTTDIDGFQTSVIMPDGSFFLPTAGNWDGSSPFHFWFGDTRSTITHFPIPEDWVAGSYEIVWNYHRNLDGHGEIVTMTTTSVTVPALPSEEEEIVIPSWIKKNAEWWASNQIDDDTFVGGLQWLISNGVMHIPPTEQGAGSDDVIPGWIKQVAGWWADDQIDDRNFVTGLQWLITNGVMVIS